MGQITDRIRKNVPNDVVLTPGPADARIWVNQAEELMINIDGTPVEVGAGGGGGSGDTLELRASAPSGTDDAAWVEVTGTSPTMVISVKARVSTVVYTVAAITV